MDTRNILAVLFTTFACFLLLASTNAADTADEKSKDPFVKYISNVTGCTESEVTAQNLDGCKNLLKKYTLSGYKPWPVLVYLCVDFKDGIDSCVTDLTTKLTGCAKLSDRWTKEIKPSLTYLKTNLTEACNSDSQHHITCENDLPVLHALFKLCQKESKKENGCEKRLDNETDCYKKLVESPQAKQCFNADYLKKASVSVDMMQNGYKYMNCSVNAKDREYLNTTLKSCSTNLIVNLSSYLNQNNVKTLVKNFPYADKESCSVFRGLVKLSREVVNKCNKTSGETFKALTKSIMSASPCPDAGHRNVVGTIEIAVAVLVSIFVWFKNFYT